MMLFVMMFVANTANAQLVYARDAAYVTLSNGQVYRGEDVPGEQFMYPGDNFQMKIQEYFQGLYRTDPELYTRRYNEFMMKGLTPVRTVQLNMGGGMMMGGVGAVGGMMMGMNGSGGYVYGAGGADSATSNVQITNQNMISTVGSGLQMNMVDGKVNISGDPLMAIGRVVSAVSGSRKARQQQPVQTQQTQYTYNASTGQYITVQPQAQQMQTRSAQPQTTNGVASTPVYGVYSGF